MAEDGIHPLLTLSSDDGTTAVELSMERQASNLLFAPPDGPVVIQTASGSYAPGLRPKLDDD